MDTTSSDTFNGDETVLVVCENGFGKRSLVEDFRQTNRGGVGVRSIITSERNGNVVGAICVTDSDGMLMISSNGQTVRISMRDLRVMGRNTQGVKLVNLKEGDYLVAIQKIEDSGDNGQSSLPPSDAASPSQELIPDTNGDDDSDEDGVEENTLEEMQVTEDENR